MKCNSVLSRRFSVPLKTTALLLSLVIFDGCGTVYGQDATWWNAVSNGFRKEASTAVSKKANGPAGDIDGQSGHALMAPQQDMLDAAFQTAGAKAMLVSKSGQIIYEKYAGSLSRDSTPLGFSMSKSLVSLAVGQALCAKVIPSLEDRASIYIPALAGTSWGVATIKQLLKMSSGAYSTQISGHKDLNIEQLYAAAYFSRMTYNYIDLMKKNDERKFPDHQTFMYNNNDTIALSLLVEAATRKKFAAYFGEVIWNKIGAEADGAWVVNNKGQAHTYSGFSARPRDWIRLGNFVLKELKDPTSCFGRYLGEATEPQIETSSRHRSLAPGYGYQIWSRCLSASQSRLNNIDFCFIGHGGQMLLFDKEKGMVLFLHATDVSAKPFEAARAFSRLASQYRN